MSEPAGDINLIATFRAQQGHADEVRDLIVEYGYFVRNEPGNVFFEVYNDSTDPHSFVVIERYRDQAGFDAHLSTSEGRAFNEALVPLIEGDGSELQFLRRLS